VSRLNDRRQRHDSYYRRAKREEFAARSVYKLEELDHRFLLLRAGQRVLDLGCRPGSWLQFASARVGPMGHVVGLDRQPLDLATPENVTVVVGDVLEIPAGPLREALPEGKRGCFHIVLSDMAPDTSGIAITDQARSVELFLRALAIAGELGCPGGSFVGKIFMGDGFKEALGLVRQRYERCKSVRPDATRRSSTEMYIVGQTARRPLSKP
jgi:23S rRNA (uridine2552-2'-O)-methyltransferase